MPALCPSSLLLLLLPGAVLLPTTATAEETVFLYFGCGCFWHVQHEFIHAEKEILNRSSDEYTAFSGYAGGNSLNQDNFACYGDYGGLGHTEVVSLQVPRRTVAAFAAVFWRLFVGKDRIDTMDVGPEYRAAIGVPGGMASDLLPVIRDSQQGNVRQTFELREGQGDDPDTLGHALVWVYDTARHPFFQAELNHQFHDDFMPGGNYPPSYNALRAELQESCRLEPTPCPSDRLEEPCSAPAQRQPAPSGGSGGSGGSFDTTPEPTSSQAVSTTAARPWRLAGTTSLWPLLLWWPGLWERGA